MLIVLVVTEGRPYLWEVRHSEARETYQQRDVSDYEKLPCSRCCQESGGRSVSGSCGVVGQALFDLVSCQFNGPAVAKRGIAKGRRYGGRMRKAKSIPAQGKLL